MSRRHRLARICALVLPLLIQAALPSHTAAIAPSTQRPSTVVVFLQGVCSTLMDGTGVDDTLFRPLRQRLIADYGYQANQFLDYSYAGGAMVQQGGTWLWSHKRYSAETPISQNYQTSSWSALDSLLNLYHAHYPTTKFILVGHSLGGVVAFEELIKHQGMYGSLAKVITIDSPLDGIPPAVLLASGLLVGRGVPHCAIEGPAAKSLVATHNLNSNIAALQQAVKTAQAHHIQVVTAGNQQDGLLQPTQCGIPVNGDINSQWVSGAAVLKFDLKSPRPLPADCVYDTHGAALQDTGAISALAAAMQGGVQPQSALSVTASGGDVSIENIVHDSGGFEFTIVNHLEVFYDVALVGGVPTANNFYWQHGLLPPHQRLSLRLNSPSPGMSVQLQFNPSTLRAVAEDEAELVVRLVEAVLQVDVDPVDVINAAPDLVAMGAELAQISDFTKPAGDIAKLFKASSTGEALQLVSQTLSDTADVLAKPAVIERLGPLIVHVLAATGLHVDAAKVLSIADQFGSFTTVLGILASATKVGRSLFDMGALGVEWFLNHNRDSYLPGELITLSVRR
jgi:pimeloyl-ACP methyl ester carboxylesterase